ncbi:acyl-CoA synthetase [Aliiglaciecola sp. 2_MG-2023]|uniref:acyl-CoA synthetase n=1 Tax=unclassified Aliiglaciecola TaxID=2593648 RepID=UPI0026E399F0|nr:MULTISPECIES: acyl-CoA synthetase [unclassified Aliiglaciecola]MDO6709775.1 acyl-CoA synthetase [Aliiglaciecola sp. 2_MG-2023]MDO6750683.1 acyl-CoA synthetase [Aliiglaciecola sp. 1_MG-2023]
MTDWLESPLLTLSDVERFETEMPLLDRLAGDSVYDVFVQAAERHANRTALTMLMTGDDDEQPRRVSYAEVLELVHQTANLFTSLGGERPGVAFMLPTLIETNAVLWGAETAGYAVPINFLLQPEHIRGLIEASGAKILVTFGPHPQLDIWEKSLELKQQMPDLIVVRVAPPSTPAVDGVIDFYAAIAAQPTDRLTFEKPGSGTDVAAYFHTGGTTGVPKLAAHTHVGQLTAAYGCAALMNLESADVVTGTLPMFHVAGTILIGISTFIAGTEVVIMSPSGLRNPAMVNNFWRICERYGVTVAGGVPTSIGAIIQVPVDGADISSIRSGLTGASSLPVSVREKFESITGIQLKEILGMTEASGLISCNPFKGQGGAGSVGLRLPYTKVTVRRLEDDGSLGAECEVGEIGVLTIAGPTVSPGYRNAEQNEGTIVDGVLNSGDLAYTDAQSRIYIAGRSKDLIIRSGHNIDPLMIENTLQRHPAVAVAAAVGMPDVYAGELPTCYVQLLPNMTATEDELRAFAQTEISERPAWPKHIHIVDSIPVTAVGKIFKPTLRRDAVKRAVESILTQNKLTGDVNVTVGGPRGMRVEVKLFGAQQSDATRLQDLLDAYLFEATVTS